MMSRKFSRFISFLSPCLAALATIGGGQGAEYGLDAAPPIGAFLDGKFPSQAPGSSGGWSAERIFAGISPALGLVTRARPYPGTNKILLVEQWGRIVTFENTPDVNKLDVFLDIHSKTYNFSDAGMTDLVFHPQFGNPTSPNRGYVYVTYKYSPDNDAGLVGYWRLSRFTVPDGSFTADPESEVVLVQFLDRHPYHDAGCLFFDSDGYLYFSVGDEGSFNDDFNSTQKINDRPISGIFRIDVDQRLDRSHPIRRQPQRPSDTPEGWPDAFTANYTIPNDNPWVNEDGSVLEEYYALGTRSPWVMSRDPFSGRVWIGDVGQDSREEVNELAKGANYQWAYREGTIPGPRPKPETIIGTETPPIWEYGRTDGFCVILGPFYRGEEFQDLRGKCIVSDYLSGNVWALTPRQVGEPPVVEHLFTLDTPGYGAAGITTFLELPNGDVVFVKVNEFYRLTRTGTPNSEPPALLSQTGAFANLAALTPRTGLIPYGVNSPLWSDGALKKRWIAIPNDGTPDSSEEKIQFSPDSEWKFPPGTVFVKHFELPTSETNPSITRRLETRFLVIGQSGGAYGVTYRWRPDGSDADLLTSGETENVPIAEAGGGTRQQTWSFPSRSNCLTCHNANAGQVLGVKTHQLNGDFLYPETSRTANQLTTLDHLGFFDSAYRSEHLQYFLKSTPVGNLAASLETRVRSYLDANCAQCHRPGGARANFDARFSTNLPDQKLVFGKLDSSFSGEAESVIAPGDAAHSGAYLRAGTVGAGQMPPIAKNVVDHEAVETIRQWIESLEQKPGVELTLHGYDSNGDARVGVKFTEPVTGFGRRNTSLRGGRVVSLEGSGAEYVLHVRFAASGPMTVKIPIDAATNAESYGNYASAKLVVQPQTPNLRAWLKLDGDMIDTVNISVPGTLSGNAGWIADGAANGAIHLDGGKIDLLQTLGSDFTVSLWIRIDEPFPITDNPSQGQTIFFSDAQDDAQDLLISGTRSADEVNRITVQTGGQASENLVIAQGDIPITLGKWTLVALTRVKALHALTLYIDGQQDALLDAGAGDFSLAQTQQIGGVSNGAPLPYRGGLDEVRIYDRSLSSSEVAALASGAQSGSASPIESWLSETLPGLTHLQEMDIDPDGDGRTNYEEYAFGGDPLSGDAPFVFVAEESGGDLQISFPVLPTTSGLSYEVQVSFDLISWEPAEERIQFSPDQNAPDTSTFLRSGIFTALPTDPQNAAFLRVIPRGQPR